MDFLIRFRLRHLTLVVQAAVLDGLLFDASPFSQDGFTATEVDVRRGEVSDALVVAVVVVVIDASEHRIIRAENHSEVKAHRLTENRTTSERPQRTVLQIRRDTADACGEGPEATARSAHASAAAGSFKGKYVSFTYVAGQSMRPIHFAARHRPGNNHQSRFP